MAIAAATTSLARLLSLSSPTTATATATASLPTIRSLPMSSSFTLAPSLSLLRARRPSPHPYRLSQSLSTTITAAAISVGSPLPDATLAYLDAAGEVQTTTVAALTKSKTAVIFAVPGAFTPTCSQKHLPGFVDKSAELRSNGVDVIACVSVNDVFVMRAWKESLNINDEVMLLSDGNGDFTRAIGAELDLSDKPVGLGVRSRRYSMLVVDGVVKVLNMEEGGAFTSSGAEDMLKAL